MVSSTGQVQGDIVCQNADISGAVKGKTTVFGNVVFESYLKVNGDI